jgi:hypothetical protein
VTSQTLDSAGGAELSIKTHSEIKPDDIAGSWGEF